MKTIRNVVRFGALCLGVTALMLGTAGCMVIPTSHSDTGYARTNVTTLTLQAFAPGQSTLEDVMLALGEPDAVSAREHKLAYRSEKRVAVWIVTLASYGGNGAVASGDFNQERFYIFEFDSQGRLQKASRIGNIQGKTDFAANSTSGIASAYRNSGGTIVSQPLPDEGLGDNVPSCVSGEPIRRIYPNASWVANIYDEPDSRSIDANGDWGRLVLTESNLLFFCNARFANEQPALRVPLACVTDASVGNYPPGKRVVVQTQSGKIYSFEIRRTGSHRQDKPAMQAACAFIQSKTDPTQLRK